MWRMLQLADPQDFVIATGKTHALQDFVAQAFAAVDLDWREHVDINPGLMRPSDVAVSRADPRLAAQHLGWTAQTDMQHVVQRMVVSEQALPGIKPGRTATFNISL